MKKILFLIGGLFMIAGIVLFVCVGAGIHFDFRELGSMRYVTNKHVIEDSFEGVSIDTVTADVEIKPSEDGQCRVVCHEKEKMTHTVAVQNGVLKISLLDERNWLDHLKGTLFSFGSTSVTVYLPQREYDELKVDNTTGYVKLAGEWKLNELDLKTTTGDIQVKGVVSKGDVSFRVSTGKITLENAACKNLIANGSTGKVVLKNVIASDTMRLKCSTGDIKLEYCDAGEVSLKTTTGNVTGSFLTPKIIYAKSTTGKVDVPQLTSGGLCEVSVTTGDIYIKIP